MILGTRRKALGRNVGRRSGELIGVATQHLWILLWKLLVEWQKSSWPIILG
jgi:hypothetical protein